jgi:hypothetical protein
MVADVNPWITVRSNAVLIPHIIQTAIKLGAGSLEGI